MHVGTNSQKLKVVQKCFGRAWSKYGFSQSDFWTLKLTVSQEWTDEINSYIACKYNFMEIKRWLNILGVGMVRYGCGQSRDKTLKPTVSDGWTDGINWFLACWHRFTKIKSRSKILNFFCVIMGVASLVMGL